MRWLTDSKSIINNVQARQIGCNLHHFGREIIYHECKLQVYVEIQKKIQNENMKKINE